MEEERRWWFHWQNLNERRRGADGRTPKGFPWHGRAWLHFPRGNAHIEWALGSLRAHIGFRHTDEGVLFAFAVPLLSIYFGIEAPWAWRDYKRGERELRWSVHDWAIWWNHWTPAHSWSSKTPKYRNGCFHIDDFFLGKTKFSERALDWRWIRVPMPERTYYGAAKLEEATWKRSRWFAKRITRCHIEMLPGEQIPVPGKGENSWDCGDDATFGSTATARSIEEGIGELVGDCLKRRSRYGGREWMPSKAEETAA